MDMELDKLQFGERPRTDRHAEDVLKGQKLVIGAVALTVLATGVVIAAAAQQVASGFGAMIVVTSWVLRLLAALMAIYGVVRVAAGLRWHMAWRVLLALLLLVPLVNLIVLLTVNSRATAFLRRNGYTVGLAGARR